MAQATAAPIGVEISPTGRRAVWGGFLSFFVDVFDIYLPVIALGPALSFFIPSDLSSSQKGIVSGSIFVASLIGRPVGAFIFGRYADRVGRKRSTVLCLYGAALVTGVMATLPGYATGGASIIALFILLRLMDGVFLGGNYSGAVPLAMEQCPRQRRGYYGSIIQSGYPLAYAAISLIVYLILRWLPSDGVDSSYVQWGWRIPFVVGALLAFGLGTFYLTSVTESKLFEQDETDKSAKGGLGVLSARNRGAFIQVFVLMTGFWLSLQPTSAVTPSLLESELGWSSQRTTLTLVVTYLVIAAYFVASGTYSQRIGRRRFLCITGVLVAVASPAMLYAVLNFDPDNAAIYPMVALTILLGISCWSVASVYISERFATDVRATGVGLGYSLAVVIPAFYAYYQAALARMMDYKYTAIPLLIAGGVLVVIGALLGPETKDVDLSEVAGAPADGR
jgi:MFS family permease